MNGISRIQNADYASIELEPWAQILDHIGTTNPRLKPIAEFIIRSNITHQEERARQQEKKSKVKRVIRVFKRIKEENEILNEEVSTLAKRNEMLAFALGACPECWGENPDCSYCKGNGKAGTYLPDLEAYDKYVLPAVEKLQAGEVNKKKEV